MTQTPASTDVFPDSVQELQDIGEEYGCEREIGEIDEEYGLRINAYLDDMIEELHATQDKVQELLS